MAGALNFLLVAWVLQGALCAVFQVNLPQTIEVLSGSCVTIPCSFTIRDRYESDLDNTCRALWKQKGDNTVVFDSRTSATTTINGELTGDLTKKDCTTTLNNIQPAHSKEYNFRLECDNELINGFPTPISISVKADPPRPTLTPSTLKVKEGASVSLKCSAPAPCLSHPPTLTWTPGLGYSQESLQENRDKTKVKTSVVNFTASHLHHGKTISCTAVYSKQDGSTESAVSTNVTADISFAPQILPSYECTKAAAQLNCSCETVGNPSPTVQWYLDGSPVNHSDKFVTSNESQSDTGLRGIIAVNQPQERDLSTLLCRSSNSLGSASFYVYRLEPQTCAASQDCSCRVTLLSFIVTVSVLTAAFICALLFAIRACCRNATKNQCKGDTNTAVMSQRITSEKENKVSVTSEEDIYVNANMIIKSNMANAHQGHQQDASKKSEKKNEEDSDVVYSGVIWKSKKKGERSGGRNLSGSSYLEEERGAGRNYVVNAVEMEVLYDKIVTGKAAKMAEYSEYAQVHF